MKVRIKGDQSRLTGSLDMMGWEQDESGFGARGTAELKASRQHVTRKTASNVLGISSMGIAGVVERTTHSFSTQGVTSLGCSG